VRLHSRIRFHHIANGEVGAGVIRLQGVGARRGKAGVVPGGGSGGAAWEAACESRIGGGEESEEACRQEKWAGAV
jgi:hypothetical protein